MGALPIPITAQPVPFAVLAPTRSTLPSNPRLTGWRRNWGLILSRSVRATCVSRGSGRFRPCGCPVGKRCRNAQGGIRQPLWATPRGHQPECGVTAGVGMALIYQGNGLGSLLPDPAAARLRLTPEGKIEAAADLVEMGQGIVAVLCSVTAEALGCAPEDVVPAPAIPPSGWMPAPHPLPVAPLPPFWGWKGLPGLSMACWFLPRHPCSICPRYASCRARGIYNTTGNSAPVLSLAELAAACRDFLPEATFDTAIPSASWSRDNARFLFCGGAVVARVEISLADGQVRVTDTELHSAAGPVLSPPGYMGQMEGHFFRLPASA
ncbi:molybdopterin-dependent oxidoreductase [Komagataeibacter rhaeticus]|nr:molybdopterin-dependent oxidoreductase [Komagataeibacter rhaeticus]